MSVLEPSGTENEKESLEKDKLRLEIKKLKSETSYSGDFSRTVWPIVSSILTVSISFVALFLSLYNQREQSSRESQARLRTSLDSSLANATSESPVKQIAGIWALNEFWDQEQYWPVIANTLSSILVLDTKPEVHLAAAEVVGHAIEKNTPREKAVALRYLLYGDANTFAVGTVVRSNWMLSGALTSDPAQKISQYEKIAASGEAIRKNWELLEDGYFKNTNLVGIELYDSLLTHANFEHAELFMANLSGADLSRAYLKNADLTCANLARANIAEIQEWGSTSIGEANIKDIKNSPAGFKGWALGHGAIEMSEDEWKARVLRRCRSKFERYLHDPNGNFLYPPRVAGYPF